MHFYGILMPKQVLGERAVELLHDSLVSEFQGARDE